MALQYHRDEVAVVLRATIAPTAHNPAKQADSTTQGPQPASPLHASALVMELRAIGAVPAHVAPLITKLVLARLDDVPGLRTFSPDDLRLMLSIEKQRDVLGCDEVKCMAEVGGALGTDLVIYGEIGIVGSQYSLNLTAIEARCSLAVARVSLLAAANEDALTASVPAAVASLLGKIARERTDPTAR